MTEISVAVDNVGFDGNTLSLEFEVNEDVYNSGLEIFIFKTDDKIIDYISLMGNNTCPYAIMIGEKYTCFIAHYYKFIENNKTEEGTLLISSDPINYHPENCGVDSFKKLEHSTSWPDDEEDIEDEEGKEDEIEEDDGLIETNYCNGNI